MHCVHAREPMYHGVYVDTRGQLIRLYSLLPSAQAVRLGGKHVTHQPPLLDHKSNLNAFINLFFPFLHAKGYIISMSTDLIANAVKGWLEV